MFFFELPQLYNDNNAAKKAFNGDLENVHQTTQGTFDFNKYDFTVIVFSLSDHLPVCKIFLSTLCSITLSFAAFIVYDALFRPAIYCEKNYVLMCVRFSCILNILYSDISMGSYGCENITSQAHTAFRTHFDRQHGAWIFAHMANACECYTFREDVLLIISCIDLQRMSLARCHTRGLLSSMYIVQYMLCIFVFT